MAGRPLARAAGAFALTAACASAAQPAPKFDGARAFFHIQQLVGIGPRVAGTYNGQLAREYIRRHLEQMGLKVEEQPFEAATPLGHVKMANIRAFLPGAATRGRLVFAGHYDTKRFADFDFVGANDGGSSTAFLLALADALKGRSNAVPIELLFLDGEEAVVEWEGDDNTYGSRHYVEAARANGSLQDIRALVLVDMIGDRQLKIKRDTNSTPWLTDVIWNAARALKRPEFVEETTAIDDDHIPFVRAGVPAVDVIDLEYPDESRRYWHTRHDTIERVSEQSLQAVGDVILAALPELERRGSPPR